MSQRVYAADGVTVTVDPDATPINLGRGDYVETIPVEDVERYPWGVCPRCRRIGLLGVICRDYSP